MEERTEAMNEVQLFENKYLAAFKDLSNLKKEVDRLTKLEKSLKDELEQAMNRFGINGIKNEYITISRVAESKTTTLDVKMLEEKEPGLYDELLKDYPKVTNKKASLRFTVK